MTTDRITRLADALLEVGHRIDEISTELRDLRPYPTPLPLTATFTTSPTGHLTNPPPLASTPAGSTTPAPLTDSLIGHLTNSPAPGQPTGNLASRVTPAPLAGSPAGNVTIPPTGSATPATHTSSPAGSATPATHTGPPAGDTFPPAFTHPPTGHPNVFVGSASDPTTPIPVGHHTGDATAPTLTHPPLGAPYPGAVAPMPPVRPTPRWQREGFGARALALVGGTVTLAGVVLLLVLAVQRGYLSPLPRVLLGAALGLGLVGIGLRLHRTPAGRTGALACAATGITVLYLDVVAATSLFGYLPAAAGLAVGLGVAAGGVLLADRWDAEVLAVFVVVGCAVSAPILTDGFTPLLLGFLLVLQLGITPVHLARRWRLLCLAAALPAVLGSLAAIVLDSTGADSTTVAFLGLVTSLAQVGVATAGAVRDGGDGVMVGQVLLAPVPAMLAASLVPQLAAIVLPGTVGALLVLVWVLGLRRLPDAFAKAAGGAGSVAVLQATLTAVDGSVVAIVLLAQALLLTLVAHSARYPAALPAAGLFAGIGLGATLLTAAPLDLLAQAPTRPVPAHVAATAGLTGLLLAVTAVAMCVVGRRGTSVAGLVALYGAAAAVLSATLLVSPDRTGFVLGHVLVTVSWTVGALVLLVRGIDSAFARTAGMSLVGAALVKLVLFDLSSLDGMARVAVFLVAGLVLLAAGTRYAKLLTARPPRTS